ncbi:MAG: hypothetical protein A2075_11345 [Geobacteraceae bacterium GWC2_58_44]|nr:MAG: hypothetical protein A2075_11345 [Geobacteraceae bacterium GWC2_58_44]HBG04855.1 DNA-binding protein [Geobacter sp.]
MTGNEQELQQLQGIGRTLAQRLVEAGIGSIAKVAAAGEDQLCAVKGIKRSAVPQLMAQAGALQDSPPAGKEVQIADLELGLSGLRDQLRILVASAAVRYAQELVSKPGLKLFRSIEKLSVSLDKIEGRLELHPRRAGKVLAKAGKRLSSLGEADLVELRTGFNKARNALKQILV